MKIEVYSKDLCPYCDAAKSLLERKGYEYSEIKVGRDITREKFLEMFPGVRTVPQIIIDNVRIGGYDKLTEHSLFN